MGDTLTVLSDDKIFVLSKLKAFADKNFSVAQMNQFFSNRVEDITEKGENAGYQHFFLTFLTVFNGHQKSVFAIKC